MIEFKINPISGHSYSYLDVQFSVNFPKSDIARIEIFNNTTKEQLDILSVSSGRIENDNTIIVKNVDSISGYINLFNKDKMNESLDDHLYIELKCSVILPEHTFEDSAVFYNESKSLDASVIPFDLIVDNPNVDVDHNIPLGMHITCDSEQKIELAIGDKSKHALTTFQVITKIGNTNILIPSEIIWHDLQHSRNQNKCYHVYWCKPEGMDHLGMRARKYIEIKGICVSLNNTKMMPTPQPRLGPTGSDLPGDFVLSSRYFVHTWRGFTELGNMPDLHKTTKMLKISRFLIESQDLNRSQSKITTFSEKKDRYVESNNSIKSDNLKNNLRGVVSESFAKTYHSKRIPAASDKLYVSTFSKPPTGVQGQKSKGCGCSRKK